MVLCSILWLCERLRSGGTSLDPIKPDYSYPSKSKACNALWCVSDDYCVLCHHALSNNIRAYDSHSILKLLPKQVALFWESYEANAYTKYYFIIVIWLINKVGVT